MIDTVKYFGPLVHKNPHKNNNKLISAENNIAITMLLQIEYLKKIDNSFYIF